MQIYPDCPYVTRFVEIGGLTKTQHVQKLQEHSIMMNKFAEQLFSDERFITSDKKYNLKTVELTVKDLGFPNGASITQIFKQAISLGLELCPLELGPHLRLNYLDQPEGFTGDHSKNQAPTGSITIASEILAEEDDFPKGFYLRRINGVLWLRGYIADDLHIWNPDDHFIFVKP